MQLLESEDNRLIEKIRDSDGLANMIKQIADRDIQSDEEGEEEGESEVIGLARRCADLLVKKKGLVEG